MVWIKLVNRFCYALALGAIVFGASGSIFGIWSGESQAIGKSVATGMVLLAAATGVIVVNQTLGMRLALGNDPLGSDVLGVGEARQRADALSESASE